MKIAALPQVEFDSFPTDDSTKICIFTKPPHPVPDLSKLIRNGRKLALYCVESTVLTIGRLPNTPIELFHFLPTGTCWKRIDGSDVGGLDTPFGIACLESDSVSDSVMLLIFLLNGAEHPNNIILYTGTFRICRGVLTSNLFVKYRKFINDIYIDNTLANSKHVDAIQDARASNDIKRIIDAYPNYKIHLQTEMFDKLDLLVELAQRNHFNVKLSILQQIFFYKSKYKHLFEYDKRIPDATNLNKAFRFKNRPKISVIEYETADMEVYEQYFNHDKIITIRLIASESHIEPTPKSVEKGLVYIAYADHAGEFTLNNFIHAVQPKCIHPIFDYGIDDNSISEIRAKILNEDCMVDCDSHWQSNSEECSKVTLDDMQPASRNTSFLDITTALSAITVPESESITDNPASGGAKPKQNAQTNTTSDDEPVIIEISDEESVTIDVMCKEPSRKRFLPKSVTHQKSKQFKPNDANGSEIRSMSRDINSKRNTPANDAVENHSNDSNGIMAKIDFDTRNYDASSISSPEPLVFPID